MQFLDYHYWKNGDLCGSCALLLLLLVGGCQFAVMMHLYNPPIDVASPICHTHHVVTWCVGIGAYCTNVHVGVVCMGTRIAGVNLGVDWYHVALDVHDASWMLWLCYAILTGIWSNGG